MSNSQKLADIFTASLQLSADNYSESLEYNTIPEWDSTGHMALIVGIEAGFDVMLDMDDIIEMSSVSVVKKILNKYGVSFEQ